MYKVFVTFKEEEYLRLIKFVEFESLAAVFVFIDQYEKHSKFECSYKIEYFK